jgi:hypothetical protein
MPACPNVGIGRKQRPHTLAQLGQARLEHKLEMIREKDEGEHPSLEADHRTSEHRQQSFPLEVIADNVLATITPGHHMLDRTWILNP